MLDLEAPEDVEVISTTQDSIEVRLHFKVNWFQIHSSEMYIRSEQQV